MTENKNVACLLSLQLATAWSRLYLPAASFAEVGTEWLTAPRPDRVTLSDLADARYEVNQWWNRRQCGTLRNHRAHTTAIYEYITIHNSTSTLRMWMVISHASPLFIFALISSHSKKNKRLRNWNIHTFLLVFLRAKFVKINKSVKSWISVKTGSPPKQIFMIILLICSLRCDSLHLKPWWFRY